MNQPDTLNAICPYYTMYPLSFPIRVLRRVAGDGGWVLDPFCGRGTTNFAARLLGLPSVGIDSSPIAVAIARAKLAQTNATRVIDAASRILAEREVTFEIPRGRFWDNCYHPTTLSDVCKLRAAMLSDCRSSSRIVLRAILLGALHGPLTKHQPSHLSNQSPRTFAPKPNYAVDFWEKRGLRPPKVNVLDVVRVRANRYLSGLPAPIANQIRRADSRTKTAFGDHRFSFVVTSPPYYGMRTYLPDQWLRNWFLGGPATVPYTQPKDEISHCSPDKFIQQLSCVWANVAQHCRSNARLVVRFGGINDRKCEPLAVIKESLSGTRWRIRTARPAGNSDRGKRQARQFGQRCIKPMPEYDVYADLA